MMTLTQPTLELAVIQLVLQKTSLAVNVAEMTTILETIEVKNEKLKIQKKRNVSVTLIAN